MLRVKRFPFYITVTRNCTDLVSAVQIFIHKGNRLPSSLKIALGRIHHIIRNADLCCNFSGIIYRAESTASAVFFLYFRFFVLPDLHRPHRSSSYPCSFRDMPLPMSRHHLTFRLPLSFCHSLFSCRRILILFLFCFFTFTDYRSSASGVLRS